jgi:hypothetical protein
VLGDEAGERHRQVVAHADLSAAVVDELVHQLLVLARLAGQDLKMLEDRRLDRLEAVPLEDGSEALHDRPPQEHLRRQLVAEAGEELGLDPGSSGVAVRHR